MLREINQGHSWLLLIVLFSLTLQRQSAAQTYFSRHYTEIDGLANSMVFGITQDTSGVMWFSTRAGVTSYDGIDFRNYGPSDGLPKDVYTFLQSDRNGILWAIPQRGDLSPFFFNGKHWQKYTANPAHSKTHTVTDFKVHYDNDSVVIYVSTLEDGLFICRKRLWKQLLPGNRPGLENRMNALVLHEGELLIASGKGMYKLRGDLLETCGNINDQLPSLNIMAMFSNSQDSSSDHQVLYLFGNNFMGYLRNGTFVPLTKDFRMIPTTISNPCLIYPDRKGNVWFGNDFYLYCFSHETMQLEHLTRHSGLISEGANAVFFDRELNTWIAGNRGISKIPSRRFAAFSKLDGLAENEVTSGIEIIPGKMVFGHQGVLTFCHGTTFHPFSLVDKALWDHNARVQDLAKDEKGNLWVAATELGLARVSPGFDIVWFQSGTGKPERFNSVVVMPDGRIFCSGDLHVYELRKGCLVPLSFRSIPGTGIRKLFAGENGKLIMVSVNQGVIEAGEDGEKVYLSAGDPQENNVFAYYADHHGIRYAGTAAGLFRVMEHGLEPVKFNADSITKPVYAILEDHLERLWMGTDNGVYRWDGNRLDHFTRSDGLSGQEINRDAFFMDHQHQLWFGTNNGLTLFRPNDDYASELVPPPRVIIPAITTHGDTLKNRSDRVLSGIMNNLSFRIRIPSYINEQGIFYSYILEGLDTGWSAPYPFRGNRITFNALPPGTYRLAIKAKNPLGIWSDPAFSEWIVIKPPVWLRWWFILAGLFFLAGVAFFIGRLILVARYNRKLEEVVAVRTAELVESERQLTISNKSKDHFFSIIAHDLKSPFNAILGMLDLLNTSYEEYSDVERKKMLGSVRSASVRTIALLENLLTWAQSQKGILPFEPEPFRISELIDENLKLIEPAAHAKNISIFRKGDPAVMLCADRNMIRTVVRNLISNAVKFTYPGGEVVVQVETPDSFTTRISVHDNGMGIPKESLDRLFRIDDRMAKKGTNNETGTGLGLILCKDFIEKNNGRISVTSEEGNGSVFTVELPSVCG